MLTACRRALALALLLAATPVAAQDSASDLVARGEYLVRAAGCGGCHTDVKNKGAPFAGGRALGTPYGTFYSPNITPDKKTGIGRWARFDLRRALRFGLNLEGDHYYPAFPYTTYTKITNADIKAIWTYLSTLEPVARRNRAHELEFPYDYRYPLGFWKSLFFAPGGYRPDPERSAQWNRGAYLVEALAHCGECHTPRNTLGAMDRDLWLAGTPDGPEGQSAPNITPDPATGIGDWSEADLVQLLRSGLKPGFDDVQGAMAEAFDHGLKQLTAEDLKAIATYVLSQPAIANKVARKPKPD